MKTNIKLKLNGEQRSVEVENTDILLDVLRDRLGVKSPKYGCGRGDCGTCTVLLNGKSVRSCIMLAIEADGQEIITVEGLAQGNKLSPLQEAFVEHNSFQCGFCASGMIMTSAELLYKNPTPSREEIKEAIAGNLCRCTGYLPIIEAIEKVAGKNKSGKKSK